MAPARTAEETNEALRGKLLQSANSAQKPKDMATGEKSNLANRLVN